MGWFIQIINSLIIEILHPSSYIPFDIRIRTFAYSPIRPFAHSPICSLNETINIQRVSKGLSDTESLAGLNKMSPMTFSIKVVSSYLDRVVSNIIDRNTISMFNKNNADYASQSSFALQSVIYTLYGREPLNVPVS